jgi:DnaJ domain
MKGDHYKALEVRRDASPADIQHAYRILALRFHPDRNSAKDAAARMREINEAWEVLGDPHRRREYDALLARPNLNPDLASAIQLAARDTLLRAGWRVLEDHVRTLVLENARQKVRVVFLDRVDNAILLGLARQSAEFCVALSVKVDLPVSSAAAVIDLLHSEGHGAPLPEGPGGSCRSLFAPFL